MLPKWEIKNVKTKRYTIQNMDTSKIKNKAKFFRALKGLSKKDKIRYLKECPTEAVETMCEACFNLLKHNQLKNKNSVLKKIQPIEASVKQLSKKDLNIDKKRALLKDEKVVCGIISIIGESILPLLNSLVKKHKRCSGKKKKEQNKKKKK